MLKFLKGNARPEQFGRSEKPRRERAVQLRRATNHQPYSSSLFVARAQKSCFRAWRCSCRGHAGRAGIARPVRGRFVSGPARDSALLQFPLVDARRARRHGGGRRGASEGGRNSLLQGGPWSAGMAPTGSRRPVRTRYVQEVNTIACGGAFQWEWMRFVLVARVHNKEVEVAFDRISGFRHSKSCSPQLGRRCIG